MAHAIVMPQLGLTMTHGTITRWIKHAGDSIAVGEPLVEVSTDKITYEVEATASGVLSEILGGEGDEFACGAAIGTIAADGAFPGPADPPNPRPIEAQANGSRTVASPAARKLARETGVLLAHVHGSGPRGRITLDDVRARSREPRRDEQSYLSPARRAIFRKMSEVAHLPLAHVAMQARVDSLARLLEDRADAGWTAFAVLACARLLQSHAALRIDATTGEPFKRIDIGIATDTPSGLIVPVVRAAAELSLAQIHAEIARLAAAARSGRLKPADIGGAAFSISNVGPQGVDRVVPLVDPPQTAILGMGAAVDAPVVERGAVVPGRVLALELTFDHRFVDGAPAARFLAQLAAVFTQPGRLL